MPDWRKIRAEYIRGSVSYRSLAKKHGVSFSSLQRRATREKWTDYRDQADAKSASKTVESVAERDSKRASIFEEIADALLQKIKEGVEDGSISVSGRGYRDVTGALKDLRDLKGLKSELDMQEQIARIEKLRKEAREDRVSESGDLYGVVLLPAVAEAVPDEDGDEDA